MARKGENIYKRKDGRWEGRYIKSRSSTGKANYGYVYAKSYREVKAKLISQSSCTSNSVTVDPEISSDQFEQVAMEWFQAICPKVKESTSNKYRNLLSSYILPVFGSKQLRDITHEFIETQCNFFLVSGGLKENGLSSKTVSDILSLIRNVLQFATRNGKAISCDARSIQIKRQTKEMRVLSRAEQEKLCQYLYSNLDSCNIGILVCLFTGLRVGEICALRWEDVSFSDYTIHVHQTLQRIQDRTNSEYKTRIVVTTPKSACSIRTIPVPHGLMTILTAHKASSTGYILTNSDQNPLEPRTMQNHFKKVSTNGISASTPQTSSFAVTPSSADTTTFESNTFGSNLAFVQDRLSAERYFSRGNHYEEYRDYWENGNYTFSRNENPELVYVRARDIEGVYLSDRELGNPEGFWTRNGREGWSRENILRRASHIQDVRQNTESGMSLDELSQNPVLDDTIRSYYNNPVQVAQVGSYYVFQSDGRHRTLAAQSLDTYIPVLVTGSYTRND